MCEMWGERQPMRRIPFVNQGYPDHYLHGHRYLRPGHPALHGVHPGYPGNLCNVGPSRLVYPGYPSHPIDTDGYAYPYLT